MTLDSEDIPFQIALLEIDKVGNSQARKLIQHFGSAKAIFNEVSDKELKDTGALYASLASQRTDEKLMYFAESQINFVQKLENGKVLSYYQDDYPNRLKHCADAPLVLYSQGYVDYNHPKTIGVVGTRNCTQYGKDFCASLMKDLEKYEVQVISGLAYGIDYQAHNNAVKNNITNVGVLAHGLDRLYPNAHKPLARDMIKNGGLLTEFPTKTNPDRENFPKRNRIVAGMCDAVIVVESKIKGGSMITARLGNDYNRDVFAIPGNIDKETSEGCNHLIKTNQAHLLQSAEDIAYILGWKSVEETPKVIQKQLFVELEPHEQVLIDALKNEKLSIDELCVSSNQPMSSVSTTLLMLEFKGIVKQLPGKIYQMA